MINRFKNKFLSAVLTVCLLAACTSFFVACSKDSGTSPAVDTKYYLYDSESESYDTDNYIDISGDKCVVGVKDDDEGSKALKLDGKFEKKDDNEFFVECVYKIKSLSDVLPDDEVKDINEMLGDDFKIQFDAQVTFTLSGRMYGDTIKLTHSKGVISGFNGLFASLNGTISESADDVFCRKGSKPDFSVAITFDMNGGTYSGNDKLIVRTDKDGTIIYPETSPSRVGHNFLYYTWDKDNANRVWDTRFDCDTTLYAKWQKVCTIDFDVNSTEYGIAGETHFEIVENTPCPKPLFTKKVADPKTRFKGWYIGDVKIDIDSTIIMDDCTITAHWYTEQEVKDYNSKLSNDTSKFIYIHFLELNTGSNGIDYDDITMTCIFDNGDELRQGAYKEEIMETGAVALVRIYDTPGSGQTWDNAVSITLNVRGNKTDYPIDKSKMLSGAMHLFYDCDAKKFVEKW